MGGGREEFHGEMIFNNSSFLLTAYRVCHDKGGCSENSHFMDQENEAQQS